MKIAMFYQSLVSDWNHRNAHFLRGVARELIALGNNVDIYETYDNRCLTELVKNHQEKSIVDFHQHYPELISKFYTLEEFDPDETLADADLVIVHEFNNPALLKKITEYRRLNDHFLLFFHDTQHRWVSDRDTIRDFELDLVDGILAYGKSIRDRYIQEGWAQNVWVWHEAADETVFHPKQNPIEGDLVWIGNWGDNERNHQLKEFLIEPIRELGLKATFFGVRYPDQARKLLAGSGIHYGGYLPNYKVPEVFSRYRITVHVPRKLYTSELPGIPTIRPFEAMACGIPLISTPWNDEEALFQPGIDFKLVRSKEEMKKQMVNLLSNQRSAAAMASHARSTILDRHTCRHRVRELLNIYARLKKMQVQSISIR